jgi:hypothetical protein
VAKQIHINTHHMKHFKTLLLAGSLIAASFATGQVIILETFDTTGVINGSSADTFDAAIVTAGGSATWIDSTANELQQDGTFVGTQNGTAILNMGNYLNDAKGTATGIFTLEATLTTPTSGNWIGTTFKLSAQATNSSLTGNVGTALLRETGDTGSDFYATNDFGTPTNTGTYSGTVTLKTVLDLSGWNGTDNYGSIAFYDPNDLNSIAASFNYTGNVDFGSIGVTYGAGTTGGSIDSLTLTQVPEPSTYALLAGLATLGLVALRRRMRE